MTTLAGLQVERHRQSTVSRHFARFAYQTEERGVLGETLSARHRAAERDAALTVFFLARSPEAPRTTMTVFSFSSRGLEKTIGSVCCVREAGSGEAVGADAPRSRNKHW
jgi:hypothetical protein